jgi:hypothetical protein
MKRILSLLTILCLICSLCACTANDAQDTKEPTQSTTEAGVNEEQNTEPTEGEIETTTPSDNTVEATTPIGTTETTETTEDTTPQDTDTADKPTKPEDRPIVKDDTTEETHSDKTIFKNLDEFKKYVELNQPNRNIPTTMSSFNFNCDCQITLSGSIDDGAFTIIVNGKEHKHSWLGSYYETCPSIEEKEEFWGSFDENGNWIGGGMTQPDATDSIICGVNSIGKCSHCTFRKGIQYFFIQLQGADHGHGWTWDCPCGAKIIGDWDNGKYVTTVEGKEHYHGWGTYAKDGSTSTTCDSHLCRFRRGVDERGKYISVGCSNPNETHTWYYE